MASSSTLWATASKEWVIPSKPKPGRKPKKDPPVTTSQDADEADSKGRRVQNRAAQRAFRERKQSQLAELQARILSYEQGEIERNVALQQIAKRLKEENERLVQQNATLKSRVAELELQQQRQQEHSQPSKAADSEKKRPRTESLTAASHAKKRPRAATVTVDIRMESPPAASPAASSAYSPESIPTPEDEPHAHHPSSTYSPQYDASSEGINGILDFSPMKADSMPSYPPFDCGFCSETTSCVCREMMDNLKADSFVDPSSLVMLDQTQQPLATLPDFSNRQSVASPPPAPRSSSLLENVPAYQAAVPLRRRGPKVSTKPIFPVFPASDSEGQNSSSGAVCSGDPSNCAACGDDSFGKAFCSAIEENVMSHGTCENCPSQDLNQPLDPAREARGSTVGHDGCCGNPMLCPGCPPTSSQAASSANRGKNPDYIPTNQAWKQIKEHPNVQFADLALLAEVVASRSKCTGPRVVITPPPERANDPIYRRESPPQLVPQEVLMECGRRRVREVHSEAVRDALRLLDAKFT
ncbi:hypothetical protein BKA70DRAFT_329248 [Coprinopsis sp. MPI-PUGE-AT-0042]|nr:hypothetical protein BKA70DRAFT_329248 [Coprinopsis sp. MPI-PUGE-AT-0042]